jgi:hypothetical protein
MSPDMLQAGTLAFNTTKAGAFAERGVFKVPKAPKLFILFIYFNFYFYETNVFFFDNVDAGVLLMGNCISGGFADHQPG